MPEEDDERRQMLIESDRENSLSPRLLGQEKRKKKPKSKERTNEQQSSEISNGEVNQGYERDLPPQQEIVSYPESGNIQKDEPNDAQSGVDKNDAPLPAENETDQPTKDIKAKKRKKKKKETKPPLPPPSAPPLASTPFDSRVFGVIVHRSEQLQMDDQLIFHPMVVVSVVDAVTGNPVAKSSPDRPVSSFYETRNENLTTILPLMTAPFDFRQHKSVVPRWEEMVVFNEPIERLLERKSSSTVIEDNSGSENPNVVVVFEILDFITRPGGRDLATAPYSQQQRQQKVLADGARWQRVAWAFLKLVGPNGESNAGRLGRLQLW